MSEISESQLPEWLLSVNWKTPTVMSFNFVSAVGIIFVNKIVFRTLEFDYATFLTGCHFIVTFLGLIVCAQFKLFKHKSVAIKDILPLCFAFCGFVVFNNLSLQYNTVGFYQLMKVMTTPVIAVIQYILYSIPIERPLIVPLGLIVVGVGIVSVNEMSLNFIGLFYAIAGILSTSLYQIWVKTKQQDLGLDSYQLLYYQAPISAIMVFILTPFFDQIYTTTVDISSFSNTSIQSNNNNNINSNQIQQPFSPVYKQNIGLFDYSMTVEAFIWITMSCILAFCVNLSIFLTIGYTSPISYNVLGHFKLCVITVGGIILFQEDVNKQKIIGIIMALVGIIWYSILKINITEAWDKRAKKPDQTQIQNQQEQDELEEVTVTLLNNDQDKPSQQLEKQKEKEKD